MACPQWTITKRRGPHGGLYIDHRFREGPIVTQVVAESDFEDKYDRHPPEYEVAGSDSEDESGYDTEVMQPPTEYEVASIHAVRLLKLPEFLVTYTGYKARSWQSINALAWTDDAGTLLVNEVLLEYLRSARPSERVCAAIHQFGVVF